MGSKSGIADVTKYFEAVFGTGPVKIVFYDTANRLFL